MRFRILGGCPAPASIAPYFELLRQDCARHGHPVTVNSIYRGEDARALLHRYGHHTQGEVYRTSPPGVANPPGYSSHELRSDGNSLYRVRRGGRLAEWQQGLDVNDRDVAHMIAAAKARGWRLVQPYKAGVEYHHLSFARRPRPKGPKTMARLVHLRATLPRS